MSLREICRRNTCLLDRDIDRLEDIAKHLQLVSDLTGSDVFLDCLDKGRKKMVVVAHARPNNSQSLYSNAVTNMEALKENEPAVYHALISGTPMRDLKAVTQEGRTVKQDVVPVFNEAGQTIATLIREKDVTLNIQREKKLDALAQQPTGRMGVAYYLESETADATTVREVNHRVKNALQLLASVLELEARKSKGAESERVFLKNAARVLTIADTCELIAIGDSAKQMDLRQLLLRIANDIRTITADFREVEILIGDETVIISAEKASSVALVVNELVTNAIQHGFKEDTGNLLRIDIHPGNLYTTVSVEDNGCGFDADKVQMDRLGLRLAYLTVRDKLKGELHITALEHGTRAAFNFR